jgi:two-component system nitrogen regulation sensor histidine kinase NtrY
MALVLIPILFLFIFAMDLIVQANQIPEGLPEVFSDLEEIIKDWDKKEIEGLFNFSKNITSFFFETNEKNWLKGAQKYCGKTDISFFQVYQGKDFLFSINCEPIKKIQACPTDFLNEIRENGKGFLWKKEQEKWTLRIGSGFSKENIFYTVIVGKIFPEEIGKGREKFLLTSQRLKELTFQKKNLDLTRILIFLLLTLSVAFAGIWLGAYLTRYFTSPLSQILEGTREVAKGNLDLKLPSANMEEWDLLFKYFNYMVQELKNYRTQLAEEREYLKTLVENLTLGVLNVRVDGIILTINKRGKELLYIDKEGENIFQKLDEEFLSISFWLKESLKNNKYSSQIFEIKANTFCLSASFIPFSSNSFLLIFEDVTEFIRAQRIGTWKEAAQKIAHEIKNPLTPIQLFSEHIKKKIEQGDYEREELISSINSILDEVNHLKIMVDSFSQYARMPLPQPKKMDLKELFFQLKDIYDNLHPKLKLTLEIAEDLPEIEADKELLRRALVNLIDNATEAMKFEGNVTLKAEIKENNVLIYVIDEGCGIPEKIRENIFKPYVSTKGRGSGMGLSIVDRIIKDHKGKITFEDNLPKGTKFIISLPYS